MQPIGLKKWNASKDFTFRLLIQDFNVDYKGCKRNLGTWPGLAISLCHKTGNLGDAVWAWPPPTPAQGNSRHSTRHKVSKGRHVSIITTDHRLSKRNIEEFQRRALHWDKTACLFFKDTQFWNTWQVCQRVPNYAEWLNTCLSIKRITVWNVSKLYYAFACRHMPTFVQNSIQWKD